MKKYSSEVKVPSMDKKKISIIGSNEGSFLKVGNIGSLGYSTAQEKMRKNPLKGDNDSPKSNSPPPNNQTLNRYNSVSSIVSGGGAEVQGVD